METLNVTTEEAMKIYADIQTFIDKDLELPIALAWAIEDNCEELKKINDKAEKFRDNIIADAIKNGVAYYSEEKNAILAYENKREEFEVYAKKVADMYSIENVINISKCKSSDLPATMTAKDLRAIKFMIDKE